jgi:hypothetical protein
MSPFATKVHCERQRFPGNGFVVEHDCNWCEQHIEGELQCPSICGRYHQVCEMNEMY